MWAAKGHHVKFVSVTNGDIGHWREAGSPLARRRKAEVERAAKILGITTEVLDIPAEAFEICEYGRRPNKKELARLFPFFGE
jgi:LmbE family N-acetylglucosaminyl deacetylase